MQIDVFCNATKVVTMCMLNSCKQIVNIQYKLKFFSQENSSNSIELQIYIFKTINMHYYAVKMILYISFNTENK